MDVWTKILLCNSLLEVVFSSFIVFLYSPLPHGSSALIEKMYSYLKKRKVRILPVIATVNGSVLKKINCTLMSYLVDMPLAQK